MQEDRLQQECYIWFHNNYPDLRGLLCYNLNNPKNKIDGNKAKAMGLQAGRSDFVFYISGTAYHIEMKTTEGKQTAKQKIWQEIIEKQGFNYTIIRTFENFKKHILWILKKK